jgi:hypothetical protein
MSMIDKVLSLDVFHEYGGKYFDIGNAPSVDLLPKRRWLIHCRCQLFFRNSIFPDGFPNGLLSAETRITQSVGDILGKSLSAAQGASRDHDDCHVIPPSPRCGRLKYGTTVLCGPKRTGPKFPAPLLRDG